LIRRGAASHLEHDPEKWIPVFGKDHDQTNSMIPKSGYRFSEKIMLKQTAKAEWGFDLILFRLRG